METLVMWLARTGFRSYMHDSEEIQCHVEAAGFDKCAEHESRVWLTQIYSRRLDPNSGIQSPIGISGTQR